MSPRALYGLKSSCAAWQADLAATLQDLKFTSIQADPDVWIQSGGTHPKMTIVKLGKLHKLKPESVKEPGINLGAKIEKFQLPNGKVFWAMGSQAYVKNAVKVVDFLLAEDHPEAKLMSTARNPFPTGYNPELVKITPDLNKEIGLRFLQLVGILRWAVELGRIDIYAVLSQLSQHQALPR